MVLNLKDCFFCYWKTMVGKFTFYYLSYRGARFSLLKYNSTIIKYILDTTMTISFDTNCLCIKKIYLFFNNSGKISQNWLISQQADKKIYHWKVSINLSTMEVKVFQKDELSLSSLREESNKNDSKLKYYRRSLSETVSKKSIDVFLTLFSWKRIARVKKLYFGMS